MTILDELEQIVSKYRYGAPDDLLYRLDEFIILKNKEVNEKNHGYIDALKYSEPF